MGDNSESQLDKLAAVQLPGDLTEEEERICLSIVRELRYALGRIEEELTLNNFDLIKQIDIRQLWTLLVANQINRGDSLAYLPKETHVLNALATLAVVLNQIAESNIFSGEKVAVWGGADASWPLALSLIGAQVAVVENNQEILQRLSNRIATARRFGYSPTSSGSSENSLEGVKLVVYHPRTDRFSHIHSELRLFAEHAESGALLFIICPDYDTRSIPMYITELAKIGLAPLEIAGVRTVEDPRSDEPKTYQALLSGSSWAILEKV